MNKKPMGIADGGAEKRWLGERACSTVNKGALTASIGGEY